MCIYLFAYICIHVCIYIKGDALKILKLKNNNQKSHWWVKPCRFFFLSFSFFASDFVRREEQEAKEGGRRRKRSDILRRRGRTGRVCVAGASCRSRKDAGPADSYLDVWQGALPSSCRGLIRRRWGRGRVEGKGRGDGGHHITSTRHTSAVSIYPSGFLFKHGWGNTNYCFLAIKINHVVYVLRIIIIYYPSLLFTLYLPCTYPHNSLI